MISYDDAKNAYQIERTKYFMNTQTNHQFLVSRKDIISRTPALPYTNVSNGQEFYKDSLIWFHQGPDSYPGTVSAYRENRSSGIKNEHEYEIKYTDENGSEYTETSVSQPRLERR